MYAGGKAIIQRIGKDRPLLGKSVMIRSKERMHLRKGLWKLFFFSISLSPDYLDSLFICFQLRKHSSVFGCQRNCHFKKGKIQWTPCCKPGNLDMGF